MGREACALNDTEGDQPPKKNRVDQEKVNARRGTPFGKAGREIRRKAIHMRDGPDIDPAQGEKTRKGREGAHLGVEVTGQGGREGASRKDFLNHRIQERICARPRISFPA